MTGLYFYKLVSPYEDDVTKDCKLTVNEIDHNFITLKDADINDAVYDELSNKITLTRNNGEAIEMDISSIVDGMTTNLDVDYDSVSGTITITYNDKKAVIDGIITRDNLSKEILTEVITDSTLKGKGTYGQPLGMSYVEFTGTYKPAKRFINLANGEFLPKACNLSIGDRFVTYETANDYGFLYNFNSVQKINDDLSHGWRIPSKADWDNMLNAIEPCDAYRTHDSQIANTVLGKVAGKLLKSKDRWAEVTSGGCDCGCSCCDGDTDDDIFDVDEEIKTELKKKKINPKGVDKFGMGLVPAGYGDGCRIIAYFGKRGEYWSSTETNSLDVYTKRFDFDKAGVVQNLESPCALYSIRLVKDYDGQNFHEVESINGQDYPCVLLPSMNSEHGFAIWTAMNLSFSQSKYKPVLPNNGEGLGIGAKSFYYIYVWTGEDFVKKQISEGESIVLELGLEGEKDTEYRLVNGKLVSVSDLVYSEVIKTIEPRIEKIEDRLDEDEEKIEDLETKVDGLEEKTDAIEVKLNQEILDRQEVEKQIWESLNNEIEGRLQVDAQQWEAINNESKLREQVDAEIWKGLENESKLREEVDNQQWEAINNETTARTEVEKQLWEAINNESTLREQVDAEIWKGLENEGKIREEIDNQQWDAINNEIKRATDRENDIENRLIVEEGSVYDLLGGELKLKTFGEETPDISIKLDSNYGTF